MMGTCQGTPPFLNPSFSAQVCVVSSKGTDMEDALPPQEASVIPDVPIVAEPLPPEPPAPSSTPTVHESTSPQGHSPSLGNRPPTPHSNSLLLPSTRYRSFSSSHNAYSP
jgi:hypothetical protein